MIQVAFSSLDFDSNQIPGLILSFLSKLIEEEIDQTIQESTLFRGNSICSAFISSFCRIIGTGTSPIFNHSSYLSEYLKKLLKSEIETLLSDKRSYEINPAKVCVQS